MQRLIVPLFICVISLPSIAQDFKLPKNYSFETADDYKPYEEDILKCVAWLVETPVYQYTDKRKSASAFLLKWLTGCPYVHIHLNPEIATFLNTSPDLLIIFMGGWARYSIETEEYDDQINGNVKGIEAVVSFYNQNKGAIPKDKNVEKYIKLQKKGKLESFVKENTLVE